MATYKIKAPDGNTYSIDGPDGASDDDVRAQVMAQHPNAGTVNPHPGQSAAAAAQFSTPADPTEGMGTLAKLGTGALTGLFDVGRGIKGFAARHLNLGDPNEVAADTAEQQRLEKPLTDTAAGAAGHFVGENLPYMLPGGGVMKATRGMTMLPRLLAGTGLGAAQGAVQGVLAPTTDANVSDTDRAESGALWGGAGNLGGEVVGKLIGGVAKKASPYAQQAVDTLKNSQVGQDLNLLATNLTDSPVVKSITDAMSKILILGNPINAARETNLGALTEAATEQTGTKMDKLLPKNMDAMWQRLDEAGNQFRNANDVPAAAVPAQLRAAADKVRDYATATGQSGDLSKITRVAEALEPTTTPYSKASNLATGGTFPPPQPKVLTASELMDLRRAASEAAYKEPDPVLAKQMRAYRDTLDDAFKAANPAPPVQVVNGVATPNAPHPFDTWRQQWGAAENVRKAADRGLTPQGHLLPQNLEQDLSERVRGGASGTPFENLVVAANNRMIPPPASGNRALDTGLLLGVGAAGYAAHKLDNPVESAGTLSIPLIASLLLGTGRGGRAMTGNLPAQKQVAEYVRLLTQQAITNRQ